MQTLHQSDLAIEGLVHDLNNVFTTILEAADLLETTPEWAPIPAILQRNVARGRRILDSFFEAGGAPVDLEAVIDSAIEFAGDFLQAQGAEIEFRRQVEPGICVPGSSIAWERVLFNLLINAGQAMRCGGPVEISARHAADRVEIAVADQGPGIPADILPRIFEAGFSTRPARPGLGLHIVESIVRQRGGSVSAANRGGSPGAVFHLSLPRYKNFDLPVANPAAV